jgi:hypothetical protein
MTGFSVFGALYAASLFVVAFANAGQLYPSHMSVIWQVLGMMFCLGTCSALGYAVGMCATKGIGGRPVPSKAMSWARFLVGIGALTAVAYVAI